MNTFEITLDVDKRPNREVVVIRQDDRSGTTVRASLNDHGIRMDGGGYTARFCMTLPDRKTYYSDDAAYDSGVVTAVIDEQYAAQVPGTTKNAYFELYDGDELKYTTASFVVIVRPSALGGEAAKSYDSRVEEIMAELRAAIELCVPPVVEVVDGDGTHTVTITCPETSGTFTVLDGYSPTVSIIDSADKHVITITDFSGEHSYEVPTYASEEAARVAAETARATAESLRASAESLRASAESGRATSESDRASAESARRDAEVARASAETLRAEAETARESAETARASAESDRADAEVDRVNAESDRRIFESARENAETDRSVAEQSRISAERSRSAAEQSREDAEQAREDAESDRMSEWSTLRASAISATDSANTAASSARSAESDLRAAAARGDFDGYSPTVAIASTDTEHTVTITDAQGDHSYTVPTYSDEEQAREDAWSQLSQDAQEAIDAATAAAESVSDDVDALYNGIDMLRNDIRTAEVDGGIATTENAAKAVPNDLTVYGVSEQDGTPTPDAPVDIVSAENPVLTFAGKNLWTDLVPGYVTDSGTIAAPSSTQLEYSTDYIPIASGDVLRLLNLMPTDAQPWIGVGLYNESKTFIRRLGYVATQRDVTITDANAAYVRISMRTYGYQDRIIVTKNETPTTATLPVTLRSLPDGTKDQLDLTYDRPSNRKGWAWYKAEVTRNICHAIIDYATNVGSNAGGPFTRVYLAQTGVNTNSAYTNILCDRFVGGPTTQQDRCVVTSLGGVAIFSGSMFDTEANAKAWMAENTPTLDYPLATPTTETLPDIELPILPLKETTVYCTSGSLQPEWHMTYQIDADAELVEVQERVDVLEVKTEHMWGNRLTGELTGEVLNASDAYTAYPLEVGVQGASEQASYTGKNLLDPDLSHWSTYNLPSIGDRKGFLVPVIEGTYNYHNATNIDMQYGWADDASDVAGTYTDGADITAHLTAGTRIVADGTHPYILLHTWTGTSQNSMSTRYPMLERGTTNTGYEIYVGGKPSPSPDYPQEIVSVVDPVVMFAGKNLLNYNGAGSQTINGVTFTKHADGKWTANGTATATTALIIGSIDIIANRSYVVSGCPANGSSSTYELMVMERATGGASYYDDYGTGRSFSESAPVTRGMQLVIRNGYTANNLVFSPMVELGTSPTSYVPYAAIPSVTLPVTLRGLPDGTRDTLALTYLRPSTREGWAWYGGSVERAVEEVAITKAVRFYNNMAGSTTADVIVGTQYVDSYSANGGKGHIASNRFRDATASANYVRHGMMCYYKGGGSLNLGFDTGTFTTLAEVNAWLTENPTYVHFALTTPTTEALDPIELPVLPAPSVTIYATADATPTLAVTYERDVTIAYNNLLAMVAELATS